MADEGLRIRSRSCLRRRSSDLVRLRQFLRLTELCGEPESTMVAISSWNCLPDSDAKVEWARRKTCQESQGIWRSGCRSRHPSRQYTNGRYARKARAPADWFQMKCIYP